MSRRVCLVRVCQRRARHRPGYPTPKVIPNDVVFPIYCGPPVRKSSDVNHAAVKANLKEFPGLPRHPCIRGSRTPPGLPSRTWRMTWSAPPASWHPCPLRRPRTATIRRDLIAVAARTARHGHLTLHPARRMAPRAPMAEPARRRMRAAHRCARPAQTGPHSPRPNTATLNPPKPRKPGQAAGQANDKMPVRPDSPRKLLMRESSRK